MFTKKTTVLPIMALLLAGCNTTTPSYGSFSPHSESHLQAQVDNLDDGGIVLASTSVVGKAAATENTLSPSDCESDFGLGVSVDTSTQKTDYLFDRDGQPCERADIMFDGKRKVFTRATPPGINIDFIDPFAEKLIPNEPVIGDEVAMVPEGAMATPDQVAGLPAPDTHAELAESADQMPAEIATAADAMRDGKQQKINNQLSSTIKNWRANEDRERLIRETEQILADVRTVKRLATLEQMRQQQDQILELTALLREAERKAQLQKKQRDDLQAAVSKKTNMLENERTITGLENNRLREQVEQLQARIDDFDRYNQKLKSKYETRQSELQHQIATLSADLKETESQAKAARQAAVLQAAQQIAEAERLAYAAQISQRQQLEMEAQRLQMEASKLAGKAQSLPNKIPETVGPEGLDQVYASIVSGRIKDADVERLARIVVNGEATAQSLGDAKVALNVEDMPLRDVFALIAADVEGEVGAWRVSWQLHPKIEHIADEKWTVTAEATVDEFIAYVAKKVQDIHNIKLSFKMFGKNRVVIISDSAAS